MPQPTSRIRALGTALAGALLLLEGFLLAAAPLFVAGLGLLLLGVLVPAWIALAARGAVVQRRPPPSRVLEGEELEVSHELRGGWLGLPGAGVLDPLAADPARFQRRGLHLLPAPVLVLSDPLGLVSMRTEQKGAERQLLVLPRTYPIRWSGGGGARQRRASRARGAFEPLAAVDVDGLRPYRPGTPASRIHWAALARGAGLLERRLRADGDELPLILLDPRGGTLDQLDAAVRACASLALELGARGGCRLLLPGDRRPAAIEPDLFSWPSVHARLAIVSGAEEAAPAPRALRPSTGVIYVAPQRPRHLPAALGRAVLVLPADAPAAGAPAFEVAGCRGYVQRRAEPGWAA